MRKLKCLVLGMCAVLFSSGTCLMQGVALLSDDAVPGTCFELEIGDSLTLINPRCGR